MTSPCKSSKKSSFNPPEAHSTKILFFDSEQANHVHRINIPGHCIESSSQYTNTGANMFNNFNSTQRRRGKGAPSSNNAANVELQRPAAQPTMRTHVEASAIYFTGSYNSLFFDLAILGKLRNLCNKMLHNVQETEGRYRKRPDFC